MLLSRTPHFPTTLHEYEAPVVHDGFMHLVNSYHLLDLSFVNSWNNSTDAPISTLTYTNLQRELNRPQQHDVPLTDIQKAEILIVQQWLRLIVWQASMRQGLLSSNAEDESMTFYYPLKIGYSLLEIISYLPTTNIEVHGMAIFEKIFEVGNTMLDVMQVYGPSMPNKTQGIVWDPIQAFVKTLSQTPNSQRKYSNLLLAKAAVDKPFIQRFSQCSKPGLSKYGMLHVDIGAEEASGIENVNGNTNGLMSPGQRQCGGSILGEMGDHGTYNTNVNEDVPQEEEQGWGGGEGVRGGCDLDSGLGYR
jgi:hypothetical protein